MAKKKITKKHNTPIYIYEDGGAFAKENLGGTIGSLGSAASSIIGTGVSNAQIANTSGLEDTINAAKSYVVGANNNDALMSEWGTWSPMDNIHWKDIIGGSAGQRFTNTIGAVGQGAMAGATVGGPIGGIIGGAAGLFSGIIGGISGNSKARRKARALNEQIDYANEKNLLSFETRADMIDTQNDLLTMSNYMAKGGKIYIKPSKKGTFTAAANKRGIGVQEFASKVLSNPDNYSEAMRKKAQFAKNASKWKHADGGILSGFDKVLNNVNAFFHNTHGVPKLNVGGVMFDPYTHAPYSEGGQIFTNGLTMINNGGTHEQNPIGGVPIGIAPDGLPNLVEEGEVIWQDYVFSNRLKPTKEFKDKYKVKGETFADVAKYMQKESEERPNDPISKKGLDDAMVKLQIEQEKHREKTNIDNKFKDGGKIDTIDLDPNLALIPVDYSLSGISTKTVTPVYKGNNSNLLRYAPIAGSALGVIENLFSKPDYSNANLILEAANRAGNYTPVQYTPIGNYLSYKPLDTNYYSNKLQAQAGATRRAIVNQSAGNRANAIAALLASDYITQGKYGDLMRQAEEYNLAQRQAVEQFNRATNQGNAEMALQAARANQAARQAANEARLKGITQAAALREEIDKQRAASRSANLTNLFENLGNLGREQYIMDMIKENPALLYDWMGNYKGNNSACGGYLTIKNKNKRR